jgi:hypothetical protein
MEFVVEGILDGETILERYTCDGAGFSPEIVWRGIPVNTQSLALVMDDPDSPRGLFTHWLVWGISAKTTRLQANLAKERELPNGVKQGVNTGGAYGYYPCCPPPGKVHHYTFRLMALDVEPDLPAGVTRDRFDKAMKGHVLTEVSVTGLYSRQA